MFGLDPAQLIDVWIVWITAATGMANHCGGSGGESVEEVDCRIALFALQLGPCFWGKDQQQANPGTAESRQRHQKVNLVSAPRQDPAK